LTATLAVFYGGVLGKIMAVGLGPSRHPGGEARMLKTSARIGYPIQAGAITLIPVRATKSRIEFQILPAAGKRVQLRGIPTGGVQLDSVDDPATLPVTSNR
jgi:hypothetical protein